MSGYPRPLPPQPYNVPPAVPASQQIPSSSSHQTGWDPRRSYQGRPQSYAAPAPPLMSPKPHHAPTHVNTAYLQAQASEIAAVTPYSSSNNNNNLSKSTNSSHRMSQAPPLLPSRPPTTASPMASPHPDHITPDMASLSIDYSRRQSSLPQHQQQQQGQGPLAQSAFLPGASASRHSMLPPNMPQMPPRPHSAGPGSQPLRQSMSNNLGASRNNGSNSNSSKQLARPLPTTEDLSLLRSYAQDAQSKVSWAKAIFKYLERNQSGTTIADPALVQWVDEAVRIVLQHAGAMPPVPEALYIKADLTMSGTFPTILPKNPKIAFRDFESAANAEFAPAWYRIGREYETFNDLGRAKDAYERGAKLGDVTSTYRLGMAHLLGQLGLDSDVRSGLDQLKTAAVIADQLQDTDLAAPLYVWAMILGGEFEAPNVPPEDLPRDPTEAGKFMKKAAYLCHSTAQYKVGWAYEHAQLGYAFDPFMSVQYYSLASQQGDAEADMALSKWFLCGAEKCFSANEELAFTFADKAARKGLATAEFAMGYYSELGIGTAKSIDIARSWYEKASAQGNEDAANRVKTLQAEGHGMSREEHETHAAKLVRTRTQARLRSDSIRQPNSGGGGDGSHSGSSSNVSSNSGQGVDMKRRTTMKRAQAAALGQSFGAGGGSPSPYQQQQQHPHSHAGTPQPPAANLAPPRAGPEMKRFTLSDTPASYTPPPPQHSQSLPPESGPHNSIRPQQPSSRPAPVQVKPPAQKGPETFEAMGIQTTTMKKDDCIIC